MNSGLADSAMRFRPSGYARRSVSKSWKSAEEGVLKPTIFVSHINEEAEVAIWIKKSISKLLLAVFSFSSRLTGAQLSVGIVGSTRLKMACGTRASSWYCVAHDPCFAHG